MARSARREKAAVSRASCYLIGGGGRGRGGGKGGKEQPINDGYLVDRELAKLKEKDQARGGGACQTFWAPEKAGKVRARWSKEYLGRVGAALSNPSFFSTRRMVVIRGVERLADDDIKSVVEAFKKQDASLTLVIIGAGAELQGKLEKQLRGQLTVIPAASPSQRDVEKKIRSLAAELSHEIEPEACGLLQGLVGNNLLELQGQLEKVSVTVEPGRRITRSDVAGVVGDSRMHTIWEFVNAVGARTAGPAIGLVHKMVEEGIELPFLVGALASAFRRALLAKEGEAAFKASPGQWRAGSGYYDLERAKQFTGEELRSLLQLLAEMDLTFKSGRGEARWLLEEFVIKMCRLPSVA